MKFPTSPDATNYRRLRLATGMSAAEMARALGVTRETICRREAGTMRITKEASLAMAYVCEEIQQVIWSFLADERGEGQHVEAQHDGAQHDETRNDEARHNENRNGHTLAAQARAPKKRKVKRWK